MRRLPRAALLVRLLGIAGVLLLATLSSGCDQQAPATPPRPSAEELAAVFAPLREVLLEDVAAQQQELDRDKQAILAAFETATRRLEKLLRASATGPAAVGPEAVSEAAPAAAGPGVPQGEPASIFSGLLSAHALVVFLSVALFLLVALVVFFPGQIGRPVPQVEFAATGGARVRAGGDDRVQGGIDPAESLGLQGLADAGQASAAARQRSATAQPMPGFQAPPPPSSSSSSSSSPRRISPLAAPLHPTGANGGGGDREGARPHHPGRDHGRDHGRDRESEGGADPGLGIAPVAHELALVLDHPGALDGLIEILDRYLKTEPYILRSPEPRVALERNELHLSFYALPSLSPAEHALLDATVRRLRPRQSAPKNAPESAAENASAR